MQHCWEVLIWLWSRAVFKACCPAGPGTAWLDNTFDLVLSSGFLAFASHSGFLKAVSEAEINVGGVMGTSAGALSGSLYSAGYSPKQVQNDTTKQLDCCLAGAGLNDALALTQRHRACIHVLQPVWSHSHQPCNERFKGAAASFHSFHRPAE